MDRSCDLQVIDVFPPHSRTQRSQSAPEDSSARRETEVEQIVCDICEELDVRAFESCWARTLRRSPILRGALRWDGLDSSENVLLRYPELEWIRQDWRGLSTLAIEQRLSSFLEMDRQRKFERNTATQMRFALFRIRHVNFRFVWTFHPVLLRGELFALILKKVFSSYEALRNLQKFRTAGSKTIWQIHHPDVESARRR